MMRGQHPVERPILSPMLEQGVTRAPSRRLQISGDRRGRPEQGVWNLEPIAQPRHECGLVRTLRSKTMVDRRRFDPTWKGCDCEQQQSQAVRAAGHRRRRVVPARRRPGLRDPSESVRYARAMVSGRASRLCSAPARLTETSSLRPSGSQPSRTARRSAPPATAGGRSRACSDRPARARHRRGRPRCGG